MPPLGDPTGAPFVLCERSGVTMVITAVSTSPEITVMMLLPLLLVLMLMMMAGDGTELVVVPLLGG